MKQDFQVDSTYYIYFKGNNVTSFAGGELIRFYINDFKYRTTVSLSFQEPTDADKQTYAYIAVHYFASGDRINFYLIDANSSSSRLWRTFLLSTKLELYGVVANITQASVYLQPYAIEDPEELHFYYLDDCEVNRVDKTNYLDSEYVMYGAFKENVDVLNPTILIEYQYNNSKFSYCYCYIPSTNRYYFVQNIICVRDNIYQVNLHVDVLMTYRDDIIVQNGYISRSEKLSTFLTSMADDRIPLLSVKEITYPTLTDTYQNPNLKNVTFTSNPTQYSYIMNALASSLFWIYNNYIPSPDTDLCPDVINKHVSGDNVWLFNKSTLSSITQANVKDSGTASFIKSIVMFPIDDMRTLVGITATATPMNSIGVGTKLLKNDSSWGDAPAVDNIAFNLPYGGIKPLILKDFYINKIFTDSVLDFLNYEPYSTYQMFIPFVGLVDLNSRDILGKRIVVYYAVDESSGQATCFVKTYDTATSTWKTIYSATCQVGIQIPIDSTNHLELEKTKQNIYLNMLMGTLTSLTSFGGGNIRNGASGDVGKAIPDLQVNALGLVGGLGKTAVSGITALNSLMDRASVHPSTPETALYDNITDVWVRVSHANPAQLNMQTNAVFPKLNGRPYKAFGNLNDFVGSGYIEVTQMHWEQLSMLTILKPEIEEIESLASNGIIL